MDTRDEASGDREPTGAARNEERAADGGEDHERDVANVDEQDPARAAEREPGATDENSHEQAATSDDAPELVGLKPRLFGLFKLKTATITAVVFGVIGLIANVGDVESFWKTRTEGRTVAVEEKAIQASVRGHYEAIGVGDYEKAYSYFGLVERAQVGSEEGWTEGQTRFCPVESARIESIEAGGIDGDRATATANVNYAQTCGESDWTFIWNLLKEDGTWKLDSQESAWANSSSVPEYITYQNTGPTKSGEEEIEAEALGSVETSATAEPATDADGRLITYEPAKAADGDPETAWQVAGDGKGEWVLLKFDEPMEVGRIGVIPGYDKIDPTDHTDRFYQMYTVREARIELSDGTEKVARFDRDPEKQFVEIPETGTEYVKITILDSYPPGDNPDGSSYEQVHAKTAISEVEVEGP